MNFKKLLSLFTLTVLFSACTAVVFRPAVDDVKKVAIVNLSMNREFYDMANPPKQGRAGEGIKTFSNILKNVAQSAAKQVGLGDAIDPDKNERNAIVGYASKIFTQELAAIGRWDIVPPEVVVANPSYKSILEPMSKPSEEERVLPPGMLYVPPSAFIEEGQVYRVGSWGKNVEDPTSKYRETAAELCKNLGVDAVAFIYLDVAYRFNKLAKVRFGTGGWRAIPSVSSQIIVINKNGNVAVNIGESQMVTNNRHEGETVAMVGVSDEKVYLKDKDNKIVESFNIAIQKAAVYKKQQLSKELAKLGSVSK
jgi:hypothetical protein